jgi:site-specific DNA recombinase
MSGDRDPKVIFAYARQSLARHADAGDSVSVADQFRLIEEHAARIGATVAARFSDVDISGAVEARDGLDHLLAAVNEIKPDAVLIRDVSRLARDTRLFLTLVDTLNKRGVRLLSATENLEDRTLATIISSIAERERLMLAGRVAGGVREHARRGKTHGRPAYGYRRVDGQMTIHEPEATIVRRVYAAFAGGEPVASIRDGLNAEGIAPPETAAWKRDTLEKMLKRRVYKGDVEIVARRDISGRLWPAVVTEGAHPAIVDPATWDAAQRRWRSVRPIQRAQPASRLSGLLTCAGCGQPLYAVATQRPNRPNPTRMARCASHVNRSRNGAAACPPCPSRLASRSLAAVEAAAAEAVRALLATALDDEAIIDAAARIAAETRTDDAERARLRIAEISKRRARLLEAYESGALELAAWQARERTLTAELAHQEAILAAQPSAPDVDRLLAVKAALADLPSAGLDYRAILTELGAVVAVDLETLHARVIVGPEEAPLFPAAVAETP